MLVKYFSSFVTVKAPYALVFLLLLFATNLSFYLHLSFRPCRRVVFKPKYWANLFKQIFFVLSFCLLLHHLAIRISLVFNDFLQVITVLIQIYNWEIRHHSTVCHCGLADILYFVLVEWLFFE